MRRPLIVYLDSQDYSCLASPPPGRSDFYEDLQSRLLSLTSDGTIEIRYSAVHISEICHTSMSATQYSAARAAVLKRLARGKCMKFWSDVTKCEIERHYDHTRSLDATSDNDRWFDVDVKGLPNFIDELKSGLHEHLKERGITRKQRRALVNKDWAHKLTATDEGRGFLDGLVQSINEKYPVDGDLDRNMLAEYVTGHISNTRFERHIRSMLTDPENLIARMCADFDSELRLPAVVRNLGANLSRNLNEMLAKIVRAFGQGALMRTHGVQIAHAALDKAIADFRRSTVRNVIVQEKLARNVPDSEIDSMAVPTIDLLCHVFSRCIREAIASASAGKPMRKFSQSDGADILHSVYLPYVDVFRCDTAWQDSLSQFARAQARIVVGKIDDLVPEILARSTRASA